jgi:dolichol-phosphate mannosyltransferase
VIHVLVPVFNEVGSVEGMVAAIQERLEPLGLPARILFVDDGSADGTADAVRRLASPQVEVVSHPRNLGPGAAFRTGFLRILETADPLDVVVTMEGDLTSDPRILLRMLHRVWEEGDHIVLASCYLYGGGIKQTSLHRVGLSHIANGLMKKALGLSGLSTLSSFYRVYQVSALRQLRDRYGDRFISVSGFECMVEILYRSARLGLRLSEVPMILDGSRRIGRSKMRILRTSVAYLRLSALALVGRL